MRCAFFIGLTCHRYRPFTVASCSRDSTVRIWCLSHLACSLQIDVLANRPLDDIVTNNTGMWHQEVLRSLSWSLLTPPPSLLIQTRKPICNYICSVLTKVTLLASLLCWRHLSIVNAECIHFSVLLNFFLLLK